MRINLNHLVLASLLVLPGCDKAPQSQIKPHPQVAYPASIPPSRIKEPSFMLAGTELRKGELLLKFSRDWSYEKRKETERITEFDIIGKVGELDKYDLNLVIQGFREGKSLGWTNYTHGHHITPPGAYQPVLVAHLILSDILSNTSTNAPDELLISFKYHNYPANRLPSPLKVKITPEFFNEYKEDYRKWSVWYENNLREQSIKSGISSGRY